VTDGVHEWFLPRGLPLVLTRRVRARALIERSAPMVGGLGALVAVLLLLADATHGRTPPVHVVLGIAYAGVLAATPALLYGLHRAGTPVSEATRRSVAWLVLALFVLGLPVIDSGWSWTALAEVPVFVVVSVLAVWLTYLGIGSIMLWALRFAWVQFGALGALMSGALPLLMITVLVFFTADLSQLTTRLTRDRLWQTVGFLALVAGAFMVATIRDEVRALREGRAAAKPPQELLAAAPLAAHAGDGSAQAPPMSRPEKLNILAVMVVSQAIQVVLFTAVIFAFFVALGTIAVPDDVAVVWAQETTCPDGTQPPCAGTWFGIKTPLPQTLVQTSLFVAVLSGLYFTVNSSVDPTYCKRFFEPLIDCPQELWSKLDTDAIARENDAKMVLLNGPRYWLMSHIEKAPGAEQEKKSFGGIEMLRQATVQLSSMNPTPYSVNRVDRKALFTFGAGRPCSNSSTPTAGGGSCRPGARPSTKRCRWTTWPLWAAA